jgi:adenylylsulfate kinase
MAPHAFTVWFTGLSGAGKTTLARSLASHMEGLSLAHEILDGDELRRSLCRDLGFTKEDRDENVRRIAAAAADLNRNKVIAIVAAISPYREARLRARELCGRFVEVFADCSLETVINRDVKGLYRRALAGEISRFSGISDPYEAPENPDIYVNSTSQSEAQSLERVLHRLAELHYLDC